MPRRREVPKREILPDPKFGSVELAKFMNVVMLDGKKAVAERIVYGALEQVATKTGKEPIEVFSLAISPVDHYLLRHQMEISPPMVPFGKFPPD